MAKRRARVGNNRTPAQRRASQANIKKAQAASAKKRRGTTTVYHHTRPLAAERILKEGFKSFTHEDKTPSVYFSTKAHGLAGAYGRTALKITVPKSKLRQDARQSQFPGGERFVAIKLKDLAGVPIKKHVRKKKA